MADEKEENQLIDVAEHPETRPKRWSYVKYKLKNDDIIYNGRVKQVGKTNTPSKNKCWLIVDDKEKCIDFQRDIESWVYVEKSKLKFNEDDNMNTESKTESDLKKKDKVMDSEGVFLLQQMQPIQALAALVPLFTSRCATGNG